MRTILDSETGLISIEGIKAVQSAELMSIMHAVSVNPKIPDHITGFATELDELLVGVWRTILELNPPDLSNHPESEV